MRFLVSAVAAMLLALTVSGTRAQAGTIDLLDFNFANLTPGDVKGTTETPPASFSVFHEFGEFNSTFVDTFKFKITDIPDLVFNVTTENHVVKMNFAIYNDLGQKLFSLSGFQGNAGDTHETQLVFTDFLLDAMLASSFLTLKISGVFCSCASYNIAVSATPIPPAMLLFLTALGGAGFIGWRSKKGEAARVAIAA